MSQEQENPSQTLLAGVEKLVHQVLFVSDIARQETSEEQLRNIVLFVEQARHPEFVNFNQAAIGHRHCRRHAQRLPCQAPFSKELTRDQKGDDALFALTGGDGKLHLAAPDEENGISGLSLRENGAVGAVFQIYFPAVHLGKEVIPIESLFCLACLRSEER